LTLFVGALENTVKKLDEYKGEVEEIVINATTTTKMKDL
jgi:hypothetical protein